MGNSQWDLLDSEAPQTRALASNTPPSGAVWANRLVTLYLSESPTAITHHLFLEALLTITGRHFLYWWGNWLLCCGGRRLISPLQKRFWVRMSGSGGSPWPLFVLFLPLLLGFFIYKISTPWPNALSFPCVPGGHLCPLHRGLQVPHSLGLERATPLSLAGVPQAFNRLPHLISQQQMILPWGTPRTAGPPFVPFSSRAM